MIYRVNTDGLNLRSAPEVRPGTVLTVLRRGDVVAKVGEGPEAWWRVRATVGGLVLDGYVAARFLVPEEQFKEPAAVHGTPQAVHMPVVDCWGARQSEGARAYPLREDDQPTSRLGDENARAPALTRIIEWLDVENSARYKPGSSTYCNVYAYDYCYLAGVYLPRVWWTDRALLQLAAGGHLQPAYDRTLKEMNANSLYGWLCDWGAVFGWVRTADLTELQSEANRGRVCVVCARNRNRNRPGHISLVVPESAGLVASRRGTEVTSPLQSQAGRTNRRYWSHNWWKTVRFSDYGFWFARAGAKEVEDAPVVSLAQDMRPESSRELLFGDLRAALSRVAESLNVELDRSALVELRNYSQHEGVRVLADRQLRRVLFGLGSDALRHGREGGRVGGGHVRDVIMSLCPDPWGDCSGAAARILERTKPGSEEGMCDAGIDV